MKANLIKFIFFSSVIITVVFSCKKEDLDKFRESHIEDAQYRIVSYSDSLFVLDGDIIHFTSIDRFMNMIKDSATLINKDSCARLLSSINDFTSWGEYIYDSSFFSTASDSNQISAYFDLDELIYNMLNSDRVFMIEGYLIRYNPSDSSLHVKYRYSDGSYDSLLACSPTDNNLKFFSSNYPVSEAIKWHIDNHEWPDQGIFCDESGAKSKSSLKQSAAFYVTSTGQNHKLVGESRYRKYGVYFDLYFTCRVAMINNAGHTLLVAKTSEQLNDTWKPKCKSTKGPYTGTYSPGANQSFKWTRYAGTRGLHTYYIKHRAWVNSLPSSSLTPWAVIGD